jgi:hypothetical protein
MGAVSRGSILHNISEEPSMLLGLTTWPCNLDTRILDPSKSTFLLTRQRWTPYFPPFLLYRVNIGDSMGSDVLLTLLELAGIHHRKRLDIGLRRHCASEVEVEWGTGERDCAGDRACDLTSWKETTEHMLVCGIGIGAIADDEQQIDLIQRLRMT